MLFQIQLGKVKKGSELEHTYNITRCCVHTIFKI